MKQKNPKSSVDFGFFYILIQDFISTTRLNKPIGLYLLLAPVLVSLLLAHQGKPPLNDCLVFSLGVVLMRSFGCIVNDWADQDFDKGVQRTQNRLITQGQISKTRVLGFSLSLAMASASLLFFLSWQTRYLSLLALGLACLYPFTKRYCACPQAFLGLAFGSAVPMVFSNSQGAWLSQPIPYLVMGVVLCWVLVYDTQYAMVDKDDDLKLRIRSSAIWFGKHDKSLIGLFQALSLILLILIGITAQLSLFYYYSLFGIACLFIHQQVQIRKPEPKACFQAFLNNQYVGALWVLGTYFGF